MARTVVVLALALVTGLGVVVGGAVCTVLVPRLLNDFLSS